MSDKPVLPPAEPAATAVTENVAAKVPAAAKALPEQNPAFKAMGMLVQIGGIAMFSYVNG
jgi:hypothetical protein